MTAFTIAAHDIPILQFRHERRDHETHATMKETHGLGARLVPDSRAVSERTVISDTDTQTISLEYAYFNKITPTLHLHVFK